MTARRLALGLALAALLWPLTAQADKGKDAQKRLKAALAAAGGMEAKAGADDPRLKELGEAIDAVAAENDAAAAKALMQVLTGAFPSAAAEVFAADRARSGLISIGAAEARDEVRKALEKAKKNARLVALLADVVAGWPEEASAAALAGLVGEKDEQVVIAAARGLGGLRRKEGVRPLIQVFDAWQARGGEPIEAIGGALQRITGQSFQTQADWTKWWDGEEATFDPAKAGSSGEGTRQRSFQPQRPPSLFNGLEVRSRKVVIVVDVSGSMHIKNWVHDPIEEVRPPKPKEPKEGTQTHDPPATSGTDKGDGKGDDGKPGDAAQGGAGPPAQKGPPLPPGVNPDDPSYKKKACAYGQCPAAREGKCPTDENLPTWYRRMERLCRQVTVAVRNFDEGTKFDLIAFSSDARTWKPKGLVPATAKNKEEAVKWIEALSPNGATCADKALQAAFDLSEADAIVFVTDGAPTDSTGKPLDATGWRQILDEVKRLNRVRKVKIDVITIAEGNTDFTKDLARENGGEYLTVP
jgi:hypothetical protein